MPDGSSISILRPPARSDRPLALLGGWWALAHSSENTVYKQFVLVHYRHDSKAGLPK